MTAQSTTLDEQSEAAVINHELAATSESPLEIISRLLERRQLDLSSVNLVSVTDDFLSYIQRHEPETSVIGDYLEVLSKLLLLKLNYLLKLVESEPEIRLNLERYAFVRQARSRLRKIWLGGPYCFTSPHLNLSAVFEPPPITAQQLADQIKSLIIEPVIEEREVVLKKKLHLRSALARLEQVVAKEKEVVLQEAFPHKDFLVVFFLASLLLYREQAIELEQEGMFDKIILRPAKESSGSRSPVSDELTDDSSFVVGDQLSI